MKYNLLDTHTLIWFLEGNRQLSGKARQNIEAENSTNFVSIASLWEMAIKINLNKLEISTSLDDVFELIEKNGFEILPITPKDILSLSVLPYHHRDPFDRLIISQSFNNNLTILSKDENFKYYDVDLVW